MHFSAQSVDERAKDRAETKANNRIDNKVDEGIDKGLDAIEGLFKKKNKKKKSTESSTDTPVTESFPKEDEGMPMDDDSDRQSTSDENPYAGMFGNMFQPAEWESSYSFDFVSDADITAYKKNGKSRTDKMTMYHGDSAWAMEMDNADDKEQDAFVVYDFDNQSMLVLSENKGKKEGMAFAMQSNMAEKQSETFEYMDFYDEDMRITKTGRTKTIAGYTCEEYRIESADGSGTTWVTDEVEYDASRMFNSLGGGEDVKLPEDYPQGYMMEMDFTDTRGERTHYLVTRLDANGSEKIDTTPYNVMDLQQMMQNGGQR